MPLAPASEILTTGIDLLADAGDLRRWGVDDYEYRARERFECR